MEKTVQSQTNKIVGRDHYETHGSNSPLSINKMKPDGFWNKFFWIFIVGLIVAVAAGIIVVLFQSYFLKP